MMETNFHLGPVIHVLNPLTWFVNLSLVSKLNLYRTYLH